MGELDPAPEAGFWEAVREQRLPFFCDDRPLWRISLPGIKHRSSQERSGVAPLGQGGYGNSPCLAHRWAIYKCNDDSCCRTNNCNNYLFHITVTKQDQPRQTRGFGDPTAIHGSGCSASFRRGA